MNGLNTEQKLQSFIKSAINEPSENDTDLLGLYEKDTNYKQFVLELIRLINASSPRFDVDVFPSNTMKRRQQIVFIDPIGG